LLDVEPLGSLCQTMASSECLCDVPSRSGSDGQAGLSGMLFYRSSVTAYERRVTVRYVVLQVISHSIRTSRDGKLCCSTGHQSQHTNVA